MARRVAVGAPSRQITNRRLVPLASILGSAAFRRGFEDKRAGRPFVEYSEAREAWHYERGRLFALVYPASTFKQGRTVKPDAFKAYAEARRCGDIP